MAAAISSMSDLIASVPALLGFVPRDSFVLISSINQPDGRRKFGAVQRIDLAQLTEAPTIWASRLAANLADLSVAQLFGVLVPASSGAAPHATVLPLRPTMRTVATTLLQRGLTELDIVFVSQFAAGTPWQSYLDGTRRGTLPDPAGTAAAAIATASGYTIAASREDLAMRYTPAPDADRARLRPLINAAARTARLEGARSAATRARLARADGAIRAASEGELPTDDTVMADLVATFAASVLRHALLAAPSADISIGTENLALHLWRLTPEPYASELATVIATHAYCRGDGAGASCALEAAATPVPLGHLLGRCLDHSLPHNKLRQAMNEAAQKVRDQLSDATTAPAPSASPHATDQPER
ncbi:DUF4192 domain-containing protein [Amycolatopsis anabasis]|uniref:DUF4192 domain-containing protein n=1 Tax=Amycolatopsis anabasis TaxID=1840409 RepID=UPI00131AC6AC|nr:DUF4192 domain-containing protein [Amycolatopsis anabasis]